MQVRCVAEGECPGFAGLFAAWVVGGHVGLHVGSDAQKVNWAGCLAFRSCLSIY